MCCCCCDNIVCLSVKTTMIFDFLHRRCLSSSLSKTLDLSAVLKLYIIHPKNTYMHIRYMYIMYHILYTYVHITCDICLIIEHEIIFCCSLGLFLCFDSLETYQWCQQSLPSVEATASLWLFLAMDHTKCLPIGSEIYLYNPWTVLWSMPCFRGPRKCSANELYLNCGAALMATSFCA